jgi:hypothetical protein
VQKQPAPPSRPPDPIVRDIAAERAGLVKAFNDLSAELKEAANTLLRRLRLRRT